MREDQKAFILQKRRSWSSRKIAKELGLNRSEVEKIIRESATGISITEERAILSPQAEIIGYGLICLLALAVRLVYVGLLQKTPFFEPLTQALSAKLDDGVYLQMARSIADGNWVGRFELGIYRMPLYSYCLAMIFKGFGGSLLAAHLFQAVAGAFSALLTALLCRRVSGNGVAALAAGILAATYMPLIFFEHLFVGETLAILFSLLAMWVLVAGTGERFRRHAVFSGILSGVAILLRPNLLFAVAGVTLALFLHERHAQKRSIGKALAVPMLFLAASALPLAPVAARNAFLYGDPVPISAVGGVNLYIGNNAEADGKFMLVRELGTNLDHMIQNSEKIAEAELKRKLRPSEASAFWTGRALDALLHDPARAFGLWLRKIGYLFNHYEFPDILGIDFVSHFIGLLRFRLSDLGALLIFGIFGLLEMRRERKTSLASGIVMAFLAGYAASLVVFFVTSRYRLPMAPFLMIFSGFGVCRVFSRGFLKDASAWVRFIAVAAVVGAVAYWPVEPSDAATEYNSLAIAVRHRGDTDKAEVYYRKAIEISPEYPSPYLNLSKLLRAQGRTAEAAELEERYRQLTRTV